MTQFQRTAQTISNQISFTLSEREYAVTMMPHFTGRKSLVRLAFLLLIAFGMLSSVSLAFAFWTVFASAAYFALLFSIIRYGFKKQYRGMPQLQGIQTVQFSEEGLVWHNDYSLSRTKWSLYQKYAAGKDMYLLYQAPHQFNIIPRSAFADAEQEAAFRAVLELHVRPDAMTLSKQRKREV